MYGDGREASDIAYYYKLKFLTDDGREEITMKKGSEMIRYCLSTLMVAAILSRADQNYIFV